MFLTIKTRKNIQSVSKSTFKRHTDLLLTRKDGKRHYALTKDSNTFMYDHTLHQRRKHFCYYLVQQKY